MQLPFAAAPRDPSPRMQPLRALRALRELIDDPDDTSKVFTIIESLAGRAPVRMLERFRREPSGRRLLATRSDLLAILRDRAALERMPEGSLAHAYLAFLDREGISADGLVGASEDGATGAFEGSADFEYVTDRMRDTHDLWHALTGYGGDVVGELALLAFSAAQTRNPGVALIVLAGLANARDREITRLVLRAFRDGQRAAWLPAVEWEALLALPLDEVRARFGVPPRTA